MSTRSPPRLSPGEFVRKTNYIIERYLTTGILDFDRTEGLHVLDKIRLRDTIRDIITRELQSSQRPPNVAGYKRKSTKKRKTTIKKTKKNKKNKKNKSSRRKNFID